MIFITPFYFSTKKMYIFISTNTYSSPLCMQGNKVTLRFNRVPMLACRSAKVHNTNKSVLRLQPLYKIPWKQHINYERVGGILIKQPPPHPFFAWILCCIFHNYRPKNVNNLFKDFSKAWLLLGQHWLEWWSQSSTGISLWFGYIKYRSHLAV